MNRRLTHTLVGVVATALVVAGLAFSFVVTGFARAGGAQAGGERTAPRSAIPPIAHPVNESMADCVRCHPPSGEGMPRSHASYGVATCLTCHQVAPASPLEQGEATATAMPTGAESPEAATPTTVTPVPESEGAGAPQQAGAAAVPHPLVAPYDDCVGCHAIGGNLSMPENHAAYTNETCTGCHAGPAAEEAGSEGGTAPPVPHEIGGSYANCESCHALANGDLAMPENHAGFTTETCTNCHKATQ